MIRTWHCELAAVALILCSSTALLTENRTEDWLATFAVIVTFQHVSVGSRLQEKQAQLTTPDVECFRWLSRYLIGKEALWVLTFLWSGLYPPLVGSVLFLLYPTWRKLWRRHHPIKSH